MSYEVNDNNFNSDVVNFSGVVLVDFWAPWCGPCRMQAPILDELSKHFADNEKVRIAKLNVDENQATASSFEIMSIPTLKIFKDGKVVEEMIGLQSLQSLQDKINKNL